jgi:hypothetical protein
MSVDQFLLSADTTDLNYSEIRPSLDLNFARTKTLDPRITFTRASGGSYVGADGLIKYAGVNEARFDHDPVTGESLGLLVEEQRTNLFLWSQDYFQSIWSKFASTIRTNVSETTSPDGTNTANKVIGNVNATGRQSIAQAINVTSGVSYTFSVFLKAAERRYASIWFSSSNVSPFQFWGARSIIDLQTGKLEVASEIIVIPYPNGWYRCYVTATATATQSMFMQVSVGAANNNSGAPYDATGDGTSGIYIWGAQLEVGSFPTSYIPTQGSSRTRAADNASITGKNFSEWYRQDEGTLFASAVSPFRGSRLFVGVAALNNPLNFSDSRIDIRYNQGTNSSSFFNSQLNISQTSGFLLNNPKFITTYKVNNTAFGVNGNIISSGSTFTPKTDINTLLIGKFDNFSFRLNGTISRLTYYPKRLTNSNLQALTR